MSPKKPSAAAQPAEVDQENHQLHYAKVCEHGTAVADCGCPPEQEKVQVQDDCPDDCPKRPSKLRDL